jgi:outer membrane protein TolC
MSKRIPLLLAFSLVFLPQMVLAQAQPALLTLSQAIARVQTAGFDVRTARAEAETALAEADSAQARLRPQIGFSIVGQDRNEPELGMPVARQAYAAAVLSVPLFTLSEHFSAQSSALTAQAAANDIESTVNAAVFSTIQAYRRVQLAQAILDARVLAVHDQQEHFHVTKVRVDAGKSPRYILFRDRANVAVYVQSEEDAASERDQSLNDLTALLDLADSSDIQVEPLRLIVFTESEDIIMRRALVQQPILLAAQQSVHAAALRVSAAQSAYLPSAEFTAQSYNGVSSPQLGHTGGQVQVAAMFPLIDGGSRTSAVARAHGELKRAMVSRDRIQTGIRRDIADAYRKFIAARRNLTTAQSVENDAEEQLRIARIRELAGKGIDLETLDSLSLAANARETVLRSLARYDVAVAALHFAAGDKIL